MAYLKLFHGRASPDEKLDGWGEDGPIFGPFPFFHTTYGVEIQFDEDHCHVLQILDGLVYYDDMFYGDWSVFDGPLKGSDQNHLTEFETPLARYEPRDSTSAVGYVQPDSLWLNLLMAHLNDNAFSMASLSSALLEWLDVGGDPPEVEFRIDRLKWQPEASLARPIVAATCEAIRQLSRDIASTAAGERTSDGD